MKAFVTTMNEPTTEFCVWSLDRLGYEVFLIQGDTTLSQKLQLIYNDADDDFLRVDADTIVNRNVLDIPNYEKDAWWVQPQTFDWYSQDLSYGGIQFIRKEALPALRTEIIAALQAERPETQVWRSPQFYNPRRCVSVDLVCGLHGYKNDLNKAERVKVRRKQIDKYDFELARRINEL